MLFTLLFLNKNLNIARYAYASYYISTSVCVQVMFSPFKS